MGVLYSTQYLPSTGLVMGLFSFLNLASQVRGLVGLLNLYFSEKGRSHRKPNTLLVRDVDNESPCPLLSKRKVTSPRKNSSAL